MGLGPVLGGGLWVRAKEPAGQSGGGVGQGAAPEVPSSQPPPNLEFLRYELGRASVFTPAHPPLPAWAPPSAGWEALLRPGTPRSALLGNAHTPLFLLDLCLARKGTLWGVLAGYCPFTTPAWPGFAGSCCCPSGWVAGGGSEQGYTSLDRTTQAFFLEQLGVAPQQCSGHLAPPSRIPP